MNTKSATFPINTIVAAAFMLVAATSAWQRAWLDVGVWATLGLSFLVIGANEQPWDTKPVWRRAVAVVFLILGLATLVTRVIIDFSNK